MFRIIEETYMAGDSFFFPNLFWFPVNLQFLNKVSTTLTRFYCLLAVVPHYSPALAIVAGEISQKSAITLCIPVYIFFMILVPR